MKAKSGKRLVRSLLGGLGLLILSAGLTIASDGKDAGRQVAITLNAGETFVIKDLSEGATPAVHVVENPNALIVNSQKPGELVLVGTSAGKWKIDVQTAAGEKVTYKVQVDAIGSPFSHPLEPGKAPPPLGSPNLGSASDKPAATAALDAGSGPVTPGAMPSASDATAAAAAPAAGAAAMTAAAVSATAPAAPSIAPAASALAPSVPSPAGAASASGAPTTLADASGSATLPAAPVRPETTSSGDTMSAGTLMPSQSAGQLPLQKYKSDPPAVTSSEAVTGGTHYLSEDIVELSAGSSKIFDFPRRIRRVSIADTTVADLQVVNPYQINLVGHKEGFTTIAVWDTQGQYEERQIRVDPFGQQQVMLNVIVAELNRNRLEQQGINWTAALPDYNVSLVGLGGQVATPYTASSSLQASTLLGAGTANQALVSTTASGTLPVGGTLIPLLLSSNVNYALAAQNSHVTTQTMFEFLEDHDLAKILAEPHILANSGEKAEFLSGGEIPIVLAQALNTTIAFKQFGTSVVFVPTVIGKEDIGLEVKPEVSQPDFAHGVSLFGFTVPAFITRRAQTFVRLKNDQTLIIAGLLLRTKTSHVQKTPYLGDIPYLGYLFKSTSYQDQQTDLVMSVTPQIVTPIPATGQAALPTDRGPLTADEIRTKRVYPVDTTRPRF